MKLIIPFDQPDSMAKYQIEINVDQIETGDGVVLVGNQAAFLALSQVFAQLALDYSEGSHLHLGYTEEEPQGPGWRIVSNQKGRVPNMPSE